MHDGFGEEAVSTRSLRGVHLAIIALVAVALAAGAWYLLGRRPATEPPSGPARVTPVPSGSRTVTLFFAAADRPALVPRVRQVAVGRDVADQVERVVRALLAGPDEGAVSAIPRGTRLIEAFLDEESHTVYLDFSGELVTAHPGGAAAEAATVASIVRTVSENFPEVRRVQILVDGAQVGTLAGHVNVHGPLDVDDWR